MPKKKEEKQRATKTQQHILDKICGSVIRIIIAVLIGMQVIVPIVISYKNIYRQRVNFDQMPEDYGLEYTPVDYFTKDNLKISGWYLPAKNDTNSNPAILLVHGVGTNRSDLLDIAVFLQRAGFSILSFDLRGHGLSDGNKATFCADEHLDIEASLRFLAQQKNVDEKRLGIYAVSMGASCSILSFQKSDFVNEYAKVLVLDSPYASLENLLKRQFPYWMGYIRPLNTWIVKKISFYIVKKNVFLNEPIDNMDKLYVPTLFIHSSEDRLIPKEHSEELFLAKEYGVKELLFSPFGGHLEAHRELKSEYEKTVINFFKAHLAK
jgi:uncharacterized protein